MANFCIKLEDSGLPKCNDSGDGFRICCDYDEFLSIFDLQDKENNYKGNNFDKKSGFIKTYKEFAEEYSLNHKDNEIVFLFFYISDNFCVDDSFDISSTFCSKRKYVLVFLLANESVASVFCIISG